MAQAVTARSALLLVMEILRAGLLGDRDLQREYTAVIAGGDGLGVEAVAENQLAAEHPAGPFRGKHLRVVG